LDGGKSVSTIKICFPNPTSLLLEKLACCLQKFVCQFLCINFASANSYVHNTVHETFLRAKNRKYTLVVFF